MDAQSPVERVRRKGLKWEDLERKLFDPDTTVEECIGLIHASTTYSDPKWAGDSDRTRTLNLLVRAASGDAFDPVESHPVRQEAWEMLARVLAKRLTPDVKNIGKWCSDYNTQVVSEANTLLTLLAEHSVFPPVSDRDNKYFHDFLEACWEHRKKYFKRERLLKALVRRGHSVFILDRAIFPAIPLMYRHFYSSYWERNTVYELQWKGWDKLPDEYPHDPEADEKMEKLFVPAWDVISGDCERIYLMCNPRAWCWDNAQREPMIPALMRLMGIFECYRHVVRKHHTWWQEIESKSR